MEVGIEFLARVLIDSSIPPVQNSADSSIDLTVDDLTVTVNGTAMTLSSDRTWGQWSPHDQTGVGQIVTPRIVSTARRLFRMMRSGRPLLGSKGTYFQTHQRFSIDYVRRNLTSVINDHISRAGLSDTPDESSALMYAAQYRLEYFIGLPDSEFDSCFRFTGEITTDYLLHVARSDRLHAERVGPSPAITASERRRRKAKVLASQ